MPAETRYFRTDSWTVNGVTYYKLGLTQTASSKMSRAEKSGDVRAAGVSWGIRVWKRTADGVETEITAGEPVAVVSRTASGSGIQSATWTCPQTSLASTDSIIVRVYGRWGTDPWFLIAPWPATTPPYAEFTTEQLGAQSLDAATWTVYYWTYLTYEPARDITGMRFYWDSSSYQSRIENFSWTPAPPPPAVGYYYSDGLVCIQVAG